MASITTFPGAAPIDINRLSPHRTLWTRIRFFVQLWGFKFIVRAIILWTRHISNISHAAKPTYTKLYPSSPGIRTEVFIPDSYKAGDAALPLLIDIHGGGFAIGAPVFDSRANQAWANKHGFAVVSIGYRLAPVHKFPEAVHDVADQIKDILDDDSLPVDRRRVALVGYSAGGNLALTAVQLHGLHERIAAAVAYYPAVDFVITFDERDKWAEAHPDGRADVLARSSHFFQWGYVPIGAELRNPLLSPRFAPRDKLPRSIFILGCQYDMLCHDAWTMAEELAERQKLPKEEDMRCGDEVWESGNLRWRRVMGVQHGFNLMAQQQKGDDRAMYERKAEDCQDDVAEWLHRVAFVKHKAQN